VNPHLPFPQLARQSARLAPTYSALDAALPPGAKPI
jgi:hypothetical protein